MGAALVVGLLQRFVITVKELDDGAAHHDEPIAELPPGSGSGSGSGSDGLSPVTGGLPSEPGQLDELGILFCFVSICFNLICFNLFCTFCFVYFVLFVVCFVLFCFVYFVLFCFV
jgi:hypothetical protein